MNIAIVGSRGYPHLEDVARLVDFIRKDAPTAVILSGGALGVDTAAEQAAREAGLGVVSYRVERVSDESFAIQEWKFGNMPGSVRRMVEQPTFGRYEDALMYRNTLIVDAASRVVAFWSNASPGTRFAVGYATDQKKPLKIYDDTKRFT